MINKGNRKSPLKSDVVHTLPGRLRLRFDGLSQLKDKADRIAYELTTIRGVKSATVCTMTQTVLLLYAGTDTQSVRESADAVMYPYTIELFKRLHETPVDAVVEDKAVATTTLLKRLAVSAAALISGNTFLKRTAAGPGMLSRFRSVQAAVSLGLCLPMAKSAMGGLRMDKRPNADFLTVTSIVASLLLGNANSALMILALSDVAELMTSYTIERTRSSIKELLSVDDSDVWLLKTDNEVEKCPIASVRVGDRIVVHTGEKIAVDGEVISGEAVVDESTITGEFVPAEKGVGDNVFAGAVLKSGRLTVRTKKMGDDTVVSRIVAMVESSETKKAPIQRYADKFSNYLVPLNFFISFAVFVATRDLNKALKMLVIDYSCGIKLSTATAFSAAINVAVRQGILIKGGAYIEQMSSANTVLFDKTGTTTVGRPQITSAVVLDKGTSVRELVSLAMAAEETSSHPLAWAVLTYGRELGVDVPVHGDVVTEVSRGSLTTVNGRTIRVGNLTYMQENGLSECAPLPDPGASIAVYVGVDDRIVGVLFAEDRARENMRRAVNSLRYEGMGDIELLTGDTFAPAREIAMRIGADEFRAQMLPEQKAEAVLRLQAGGNGVVMVGDGINDAPALAYADVGISLGSKSTDIAIETADIVIGRDDPMLIPALRRHATRTMRIVRQNFSMVVGINTIGLILGAVSNISVFMSALMHNASTILVVANSLRLMFYDIE